MTDREFIAAVEGGRVEQFGHREHVRLAFALLRTEPRKRAERRAESLLRSLAERAGKPDKFHVTLTRAWMDAVAHHMHDVPPPATFDDLLERHPQLLRANLLDHHYSREVLFSAAARSGYVEPDRVAIPA